MFYLGLMGNINQDLQFLEDNEEHVLILVQCLLMGVTLCLTSKFTANAILGLVQFARYKSALMALR